LTSAFERCLEHITENREANQGREQAGADDGVSANAEHTCELL
jgi:hypothetical protein